MGEAGGVGIVGLLCAIQWGLHVVAAVGFRDIGGGSPGRFIIHLAGRGLHSLKAGGARILLDCSIALCCTDKSLQDL